MGPTILSSTRGCDICKGKGAKEKFKAILQKYATIDKHKCPKWYYHCQNGDYDPPITYPRIQPHPATKQHEANWSDEIQAEGPIGLLIEAVVWNGLVIDSDLKIWQKKEEPNNLIDMPYQSLQSQLIMMAARAWTLADWERKHHENTTARGMREIDKGASRISMALKDEEKGIVRTAISGGNIPTKEIAKSNQD